MCFPVMEFMATCALAGFTTQKICFSLNISLWTVIHCYLRIYPHLAKKY